MTTMTKKADLMSALDVRSSTIHGRGVFAAGAIPMGARIGRYGGRRFAGEDERLLARRQGPTYLFGLSDGSYIDGARGGNAMRFINHSCAPNCVALEVETDRGLSIVIEAMSLISLGQELLLDYALEIAESDVDLYACRCGTSACRGTMAGASTV
jgi:SET domain-containing protein